MQVTPILRESFYHDGRGPDLKKVHYSESGVTIQAVDYFNPDDHSAAEDLKHLEFKGVQVFMFTPEEVYNYDPTAIDWGKYDNAAIVCLGKSEWLRSFNQRHLDKCQHYQIMFYDEYLDIICEGIEAKQGGYKRLNQ